ncbi:MAG: sulfatase-like hydrolase/transferase [Brucellaceae bacterium]|nr:sulfatase-like hydrolase/transferase [Brucellaceae bacterium]
MRGGNVLFITIDQLRADLISGPLAGFAPTPNLDRLAATGTRFDGHFTVTVPCGPARASLLTGLYAMNHRSVRNGAPLARHHATIATEMRKAGYEPLLFGYTDTTPDPTGMDPEDPDLAPSTRASRPASASWWRCVWKRGWNGRHGWRAAAT